jgi:hypothetical protein
MSPATRALISAVLTFLVGSALTMLAVRRGWLPRFTWLAAVVVPLSVGLLVYFTAA